MAPSTFAETSGPKPGMLRRYDITSKTSGLWETAIISQHQVHIWQGNGSAFNERFYQGN